MTDIKLQIEREVRRSRYRCRISGSKVHPVQHDINEIVHFICTRRTRVPGALHAVGRMLRRVDTEAIRFAVSVVMDEGATNRATRRRCQRLGIYCALIDEAQAARREFNGRDHDGSKA